MKITRNFRFFNLLFAAGLTSFAFWEKGLWFGLLLTITWVFLWWLSRKIEWDFAPSLFFLGYVGICLAGSFWGLRPIFLFLGLTAALNAWDSDRFFRRWKVVQTDGSTRNLERRHLFRILSVDGVAIILAVIGLSLKAQLNFAIMLLLGVLAMVSLSRLINMLRNLNPKD